MNFHNWLFNSRLFEDKLFLCKVCRPLSFLIAILFIRYLICIFSLFVYSFKKNLLDASYMLTISIQRRKFRKTLKLTSFKKKCIKAFIGSYILKKMRHQAHWHFIKTIVNTFFPFPFNYGELIKKYPLLSREIIASLLP